MKFLRAILTVGLAGVTALATGPVAHAQSPAVTLTPNPANTFNNGFGYSLGYEFTADSNITVSSLGYFTTGTLTESHEVGIYSITGTLLTSASVTNSSPVTSNFAYTSIVPLSLTAGTDYIIVGATGVTDDYTFAPLTFATDPAITVLQSEYNENGGTSLAFPTNSEPLAPNGFFGPNFLIASAVPEPGTYALFASLGLTGAAFLRRRAR